MRCFFLVVHPVSALRLSRVDGVQASDGFVWGMSMTIRVRALSDEEAWGLERLTRSHKLGAGLVRRAQTIRRAVPWCISPSNTYGASWLVADMMRTLYGPCWSETWV